MQLMLIQNPVKHLRWNFLQKKFFFSSLLNHRSANLKKKTENIKYFGRRQKMFGNSPSENALNRMKLS